MGRHTFFVMLVLTGVWILLMEEISWRSIAIGMLITMACMHFASLFLPYEEIKNVNFFKLASFPFFLIGQIYAAGIFMIGVIIKGSIVDIVSLKTKLSNEHLRIMLADSITLTPGSILLELDGDIITLLWIRYKDAPGDAESADIMLKSKIEEQLLKAEKPRISQEVM